MRMTKDEFQPSTSSYKAHGLESEEEKDENYEIESMTTLINIIQNELLSNIGVHLLMDR